MKNKMKKSLKIGLYCGTFSPFHQGHYNILQKAEKIFDKVIIVRAFNPLKKNEMVPLPNYLKTRPVMEYDGLLTDLIKSLPFDNVTLIRGLRNSIDLQHEINQFRYFQDLMPDIQVVSIFCDKEFEHISSSGIRALKHFGDEHVEKYLL
jgi:pantetheine-phosphate adenylyltransferase